MSAKLHGTYLAIIVLLVVGLVGEYVYYHHKTQVLGASTEQHEKNEYTNRPSMMGGQKTGSGSAMMGGAMAPATPPDVSDQQNQQLKDGTDTSTTNKTFNITAGNFYFVPNKITVNKGDTVTFVVTDGGGFHDLVIDELGVKTEMMKAGGQSVSATFTANKTGTFTYYCSVSGHKQKGMWGTLTVQ